MRRVRISVPAPASLRLELVGVPAGSSLTLDLRLEAVMEGVLVSGTVTAALTGECGRCLGEVADTVQAELQELCVYCDAGHPDTERDDKEVSRLDGDLLDLEPALRDAVVLALPLTPLCRPDCPGLCAECGQPWAELPVDHTHERPDPRWAALSRLATGSAPADPDPAHRTDPEP